MSSLNYSLKKRRILESDSESNDENNEILNSEPVKNTDIRGFFSKTITKPVEANNFVTIKIQAQVHNFSTPNNDIKRKISSLSSNKKRAKNNYIIINDDDLTIDIIDSEILKESPTNSLKTNELPNKKHLDDQYLYFEDIKQNSIGDIKSFDKISIDGKSGSIIVDQDELLKKETTTYLTNSFKKGNNSNSNIRTNKLKLSKNSRKRKASEDMLCNKTNKKEFDTNLFSNKSLKAICNNVIDERKSFNEEINNDSNKISIKKILTKKKITIPRKNINENSLNELAINEINEAKKDNSNIFINENEKLVNMEQKNRSFKNEQKREANNLPILIDELEENMLDLNSSQENQDAVHNKKTLKINMKFCAKQNSFKKISAKNHNEDLQITNELKISNDQEIVKIKKLTNEVEFTSNLRRSSRKSSQHASQIITSVIQDENDMPKKKKVPTATLR